MKLAFYKKNELNNILTKLFQTTSSRLTCQVNFSEKLDADSVEFYENNNLVKTIRIEEAFAKLTKYFGLEISRHDVIEVGDFGEGFAFFFKENSQAAA